MAGPPPIADVALRYDPVARRFDVAIESGDLVLDTTPATAMIISLGTDRRARADDQLPDEPHAAPIDPAKPITLSPERGWHGDALDGGGRRIGSRLWLLDRAKQDDLVRDETRQRGERYAAEALEWLTTQRGHKVEVEAGWLRSGVLGLVARAGTAEISISQPVGRAR